MEGKILDVPYSTFFDDIILTSTAKNKTKLLPCSLHSTKGEKPQIFSFALRPASI